MPSKPRQGGFAEAAPPPLKRDRPTPNQGAGAYPAWRLEQAKARFSEMVRLARSQGPQRVTSRGKDAVIVVSSEDFETLLAGMRPRASLVEFLRATSLSEIPVERAADRGRDLDL